MNSLLLGLLLFSAPVEAASYDQYTPLPELVEASQAVVMGLVRSAESGPGPGGVQTTYEVEVTEVLVGEAPERFTVVLPGGLQGELVQKFHGAPLWRPGDQVVVFLPREGKVGLQEVLTTDGEQVLDALERVGPVLPARLADLRERIVTRR